MIFSLIALLIIIYSWNNFKNSVIVLCIFELFLNQNINLINVPGIPLLSMSTALNLYFLFYFYFFQRKKFVSRTDRFPLKKAFILIGISYLLSCIFSLAEFTNTLTRGLQNFVTPFLFVWMLWYVIKTSKDFKFFFILLAIAFSFIIIYAFYEKSTGNKPLMTYEQSLNKGGDESKIIDWNYDNDERAAGGRIQSVFIHPIGAGLNFGLCFILFLYLFLYYKRFFNINICFTLCLLGSLLLCVFFSNSRGPLIFLIVAALGLVNLSSSKFYIGTFLGIILFLSLYGYIAPYMDNILSLFDASAQKRVGGSDANMRMLQFAAGYELFQEHPLVGYGIKSLTYISNKQMVNALLGIESIWLRLMVEQGLIGLCSYIFLFYSMLKSAIGKTKNFTIFLTLAFIVVSSISSTPGFADHLFFIILFFSIRVQNGYNKSTTLSSHLYKFDK